MKRKESVLFLVLALIISFTLFGCNKEIKLDSASFNEAVSELEKDYGDKKIKNDLSLPTTLDNGLKITWSSSDEKVIKNDGTLPEVTNGGLTLTGELPTATVKGIVSANGVSETKEISFVVTVDRTTTDGNSVREARAALLNQYEGKALEGYILSSINSDGEASYSYNFATREDVTVTYKNSSRIAFNNNVGSVTRPLENECISGKDYVVENVGIQISKGDVAVEFEVSVQITKAEKIMTVGELRELMSTPEYIQKQDTYVFMGTVSMVWETETSKSMQGFFVQDNDGAILIYSASINDSNAQVSVGDEVLVTATTCFYQGLAETSKVSAIQIIEKAENNTEKFNALQKITVKYDEFTNELMAKKDNMLATVSGLVFDHLTDSNGNLLETVTTTSAVAHFYMIDSKEKNAIPVLLSVDKYSSDYQAMASEFNQLKVGDIVDISECAISWYTNVQLRLANSGKITVNTEKTLSAKQKYVLDLLKKDSVALDPVYSCGTFELAKTMPFGSTIEWTLSGENNASVSIEEGNLIISEFTAPFDFTVKATLIVAGQAGKSFEYKATAINPVEFADVITAINSEAGLAPQTATSAYVVGLINDNQAIVFDDDETIALFTYPSEIELAVGEKIVVLLASGKSENGVYKLSVENVITHEQVNYMYDAKYVELAEISSGIEKIELKSVTITDGKAQLNDTVTVEFYNAADTTSKYADGTYTNLKGYSIYKDATTVIFYTLGQVGSNSKLIFDANALLGCANTDTVVYGDNVVTVSNLLIGVTEIGCYGTGLQWRNKLTDTGKISSIYNMEALNTPITSIDLSWSGEKKVYANTCVLHVLLSNDPTFETVGATYDLGTEADIYTAHIDIASNTYKYFKIIQDESYTYSMYWNLVTINFGE